MLEMQGAQWLQWKQDEMTQKFLAALHDSTAGIQDNWLNNDYVDPDQYKSALLNAGALATAQAYATLAKAIEAIALEPLKQEEEQ